MAQGVVVINRSAWLATKKPYFSQAAPEMGHHDCYGDGEMGHPPRTMLTTPPPFTRRLARSSIAEATRGVRGPA